MHYIGIRGHRGAGKNTVAYLLGNTINELLKSKHATDKESFDDLFQTWCDEIVSNEQVIHDISLDYIYFESFGDTLKVLIQMVLNCPSDYLYSDFHKDNVIINVRDFSYKEYDEVPADIKKQLMTATDLYNAIPKNCPPVTMTKNIFISLREFILYFGQEVMQRYFGLDVWVKTLKSTQNLFESVFDDDKYKIYTDLKTPGEVTYIKKLNGCVIKVSRPGHKKQNKGIDRLSQDNRVDYKVEIGDNLFDIKDQIINIAKKIINYGEENK